jgi:putative transposase
VGDPMSATSRKSIAQTISAMGGSGRTDATDSNVKGVWKYRYRAADKQGKTIDFLLTAQRDASAARRFFDQAMRDSDVPEAVTMDKRGANQAALEQLNAEREIPIGIRQLKYLNNIVEQDHRAIQRVTRPMVGFKSFRAAQAVLAGTELMHRIRTGQFLIEGCDGMSFANQFYTLAGQVRPE